MELVCTCSDLELNQHISVVFLLADSQIFYGFDHFWLWVTHIK